MSSKIESSNEVKTESDLDKLAQNLTKFSEKLATLNNKRHELFGDSDTQFTYQKTVEGTKTVRKKMHDIHDAARYIRHEFNVAISIYEYAISPAKHTKTPAFHENSHYQDAAKFAKSLSYDVKTLTSSAQFINDTKKAKAAEAQTDTESTDNESLTNTSKTTENSQTFTEELLEQSQEKEKLLQLHALLRMARAVWSQKQLLIKLKPEKSYAVTANYNGDIAKLDQLLESVKTSITKVHATVYDSAVKDWERQLGYHEQTTTTNAETPENSVNDSNSTTSSNSEKSEEEVTIEEVDFNSKNSIQVTEQKESQTEQANSAQQPDKNFQQFYINILENIAKTSYHPTRTIIINDTVEAQAMQLSSEVYPLIHDPEDKISTPLWQQAVSIPLGLLVGGGYIFPSLLIGFIILVGALQKIVGTICLSDYDLGIGASLQQMDENCGANNPVDFFSYAISASIFAVMCAIGGFITNGTQGIKGGQNSIEQSLFLKECYQDQPTANNLLTKNPNPSFTGKLRSAAFHLINPLFALAGFLPMLFIDQNAATDNDDHGFIAKAFNDIDNTTAILSPLALVPLLWALGYVTKEAVQTILAPLGNWLSKKFYGERGQHSAALSQLQRLMQQRLAESLQTLKSLPKSQRQKIFTKMKEFSDAGRPDLVLAMQFNGYQIPDEAQTLPIAPDSTESIVQDTHTQKELAKQFIKKLNTKNVVSNVGSTLLTAASDAGLIVTFGWGTWMNLAKAAPTTRAITTIVATSPYLMLTTLFAFPIYRSAILGVLNWFNNNSNNQQNSQDYQLYSSKTRTAVVSVIVFNALFSIYTLVYSAINNVYSADLDLSDDNKLLLATINSSLGALAVLGTNITPSIEVALGSLEQNGRNKSSTAEVDKITFDYINAMQKFIRRIASGMPEDTLKAYTEVQEYMYMLIKDVLIPAGVDYQQIKHTFPNTKQQAFLTTLFEEVSNDNSTANEAASSSSSSATTTIQATESDLLLPNNSHSPSNNRYWKFTSQQKTTIEDGSNDNNGKAEEDVTTATTFGNSGQHQFTFLPSAPNKINNGATVSDQTDTAAANEENTANHKKTGWCLIM